MLLVALVFLRGGKRLSIGSNELSLIDLITSQVLFNIDENYVKSVVFSTDGSRFLSGSNFSTSVKMWDSASGLLLHEFKAPAPSSVPAVAAGRDELSPITITSLALSSDGSRIMAGSNDQELFNPNQISYHVVNIWDVKVGQLLTTFSGHSASISTVAFSPDGKLGYSVSNDGTVEVWDADSGKSIRTISINHSVDAAVFASDRKTVLTGGGDLQLLDTESGKLVKREFGSRKVYAVDAASFSPTGADLASGSINGVVRASGT